MSGLLGSRGETHPLDPASSAPDAVRHHDRTLQVRGSSEGPGPLYQDHMEGQRAQGGRELIFRMDKMSFSHLEPGPFRESRAQSAAWSSPPANPGRLQPSLIAAARRPKAEAKPASPAGQNPTPTRSSTVNTDAPSRAAVM